MKYLIIALSLFASAAFGQGPFTFYNETPSGYTEWTPGRIPITNTRTQQGWIRNDPNVYEPNHYDWVTTEQYRRNHVLQHVAPHNLHLR